tara:strand:+ start:4415 stop:4714 length:300 start_codon:yes stop_codon:yes gene_type:complete
MKTDFEKYATLRMNVRGRRDGLNDFLKGCSEDSYSMQPVKDARAKLDLLNELMEVVDGLDAPDKEVEYTEWLKTADKHFDSMNDETVKMICYEQNEKNL